MILYLAMRIDFYEGSEVWQTCLGVYDTDEAAQYRCDDFRMLNVDEEEATLRHVFEVVPTELNKDIYE